MPALMPIEDPFILTRDAIKVLAVDTRLDILKLLAERPHTLTEIKDALELAPATVSEHLTRLEEAGLIEKRDEGRKWKYYRLTAQGKLLFTKKPASLMVAFVLSSIAAGAFTIASFLRAPELQIAPMMARSEPSAAGAEVLMVEADALIEPIAASTPLDWLVIGAIVFAVIAVGILLVMLAKRLKKDA